MNNIFLFSGSKYNIFKVHAHWKAVVLIRGGWILFCRSCYAMVPYLNPGNGGAGCPWGRGCPQPSSGTLGYAGTKEATGSPGSCVWSFSKGGGGREISLVSQSESQEACTMLMFLLIAKF